MKSVYGFQINKALYFITILLLLISPFSLYAAESKFNHDKTGFELSGPHEQLSCDACHIRGIFKGTPKKCESCHDRTLRAF